MFVEELTKIKESENRADELQKKARTESKQILENAKAQSKKIIEGAEARARDIYESLVEAGQKESDEQYNLFLKKTEDECVQMIEKARDNEEKAVEIIVERIVGSSVNN